MAINNHPKLDDKIAELVELAGARAAVVVFLSADDKLDAVFTSVDDDTAGAVLRAMADGWHDTPTVRIRAHAEVK